MHLHVHTTQKKFDRVIETTIRKTRACAYTFYREVFSIFFSNMYHKLNKKKQMCYFLQSLILRPHVPWTSNWELEKNELVPVLYQIDVLLNPGPEGTKVNYGRMYLTLVMWLIALGLFSC